jgi:hypothetical protein
MNKNNSDQSKASSVDRLTNQNNATKHHVSFILGALLAATVAATNWRQWQHCWCWTTPPGYLPPTTTKRLSVEA